MFFVNQSLISQIKLLVVVSVLLLLHITKIQGQYLEQQNQHPAPIIVIDPGHGGKDKGCHAHHYNEKDIALTLSKKIGAQIKIRIPNAQIIFTRTKDEFIKLRHRVEIANSYDPDLFISVHANSIDVAEVHGSEIFIIGPNKDAHYRKIVERENASSFMEYDMSTDHGIESHILQSATKSDNMSKSMELAKSIENALSSLKSHKCRGIKQANFTVLKNIAAPCVLLEAGYLTNDHDYKALNSEHGQNIMADRIANGICLYLNNYPRVTKAQALSSISDREPFTPKEAIPQAITPKVAAQIKKKPDPIVREPELKVTEKSVEAKNVNYHLVLATSVKQQFSVDIPDEIDTMSKIVIGDNNQYYFAVGPYDDLVSAMEDRTICIDKGYKGTYVADLDQIIK